MSQQTPFQQADLFGMTWQCGRRSTESCKRALRGWAEAYRPEEGWAWGTAGRMATIPLGTLSKPTRVIAHCDIVAIPLQDARILWQTR